MVELLETQLVLLLMRFLRRRLHQADDQMTIRGTGAGTCSVLLGRSDDDIVAVNSVVSSPSHALGSIAKSII